EGRPVRGRGKNPALDRTPTSKLVAESLSWFQNESTADAVGSPIGREITYPRRANSRTRRELLAPESVQWAKQQAVSPARGGERPEPPVRDGLRRARPRARFQRASASTSAARQRTARSSAEICSLRRRGAS